MHKSYIGEAVSGVRYTMVSTYALHAVVVFYRHGCVYNNEMDASNKFEERKRVVDILSKLLFGLNFIANSEV